MDNTIIEIKKDTSSRIHFLDFSRGIAIKPQFDVFSSVAVYFPQFSEGLASCIY